MSVSGLRLMEKRGGKVGTLWQRPVDRRISKLLIFLNVQSKNDKSKNTLNMP
jgi:hypothetical protein